MHMLMGVFWVLWSAVFIPAHTRGMIPIGDVKGGRPACCCGGGEGAAKSPEQQKKDAVLAGNCAVCDLASRMSVSTGFVLLVPRAGVIGWRGMAREAAAVYATEPELPWESRGPPTGA